MKNRLITRKLLILVLLIVVLGVPAIHKILGDFPPAWFNQKFSGSLIGKVPFGISLSYGIIILLELLGPLFFLAGIAKKEFTTAGKNQFIGLGFLTCYVLFLILTFGSFLVEDYSNGFNDFGYFVGIAALEYLFFREPIT